MALDSRSRKVNDNLPKSLRHRVSFESENNTPDGTGGFTRGWTTVATVWAGVQPRSAREYLRAEGLSNEVSHIITIRYLSTINVDMQVKFGTRVFKIVGLINPDELRRYLELAVKELV